MKRTMRTVERWGDTGRLNRDDVRAVVIAQRDGKPLPQFAPLGKRRPRAQAARGRQARQALA